jgi:sterol desaturase/sphingolipid hydroxylase (fatty acid hydroxylase superfamily)
MTLWEVTAVYLRHPAVAAYFALAVASAALAVLWSSGSPGAGSLVLAAAAALLMYPPAWYLLHRFVLHARFLYRSPRTVALWKRIHYDHHRNPDDLRVLFGALSTTLPTIALATFPAGILIGGAAGAATAFGAGSVCALFYEFCHCVQHLPYTPRNRVLRRLKRLHLLHHLHNERGNFGITSFVVDRLAGTYYARAADVPRSATVFDLGYTAAERVRYPWLAQRSESGDPGPLRGPAGRPR